MDIDLSNDWRGYVMPTRPTGLRGVAFCHFASYSVDGKRKWRWDRFLVYGIVPLVVGIALAWHLGTPPDATMAMIIAVLAVIAAVLLGLLPLVHSILGQANTARTFAHGERPLAQQELDRVQTLQELHATISWAVILLVVALGSCAALAMIPKLPAHQLYNWSEILTPLLVFRLYSVMASTVLTFFDVARGVFESMESQSEAIKTKIRNNVQPPQDDEQG